MKVLIQISFLVVLLMNITSCRKSLSSTEYSNWFNKGNETITRTENYNLLSYRISFKSSELLALKELNSGEYNLSDFDDLLEEYQKHLYFLLEISDTSKSIDLLSKTLPQEISTHDFSQRIYYLSSEINSDLELITTSGDTMPCVFSHFERSYKLSPYLRIMLGFEKPNKKKFEISQILFFDRAYTEDVIRFDFKLKIPDSLPKLKL